MNKNKITNIKIITKNLKTGTNPRETYSKNKKNHTSKKTN